MVPETPERVLAELNVNLSKADIALAQTLEVIAQYLM